MSIAIIPAKGHSERIARKNIRDFQGKPIIAYSIATARACGLFDSILVSTDDDDIARIAQGLGAEVMIRGDEWSLEMIGPLDVARHCLELMGESALEFVCVIYATAPLMSISDLMRGWRAVNRTGCAYAVSIGEHPFLHDAAQFFWCRAWALLGRHPEWGSDTVLIPIDPARDCDLNTEEDFSRAEQMYLELQNGRTLSA